MGTNLSLTPVVINIKGPARVKRTFQRVCPINSVPNVDTVYAAGVLISLPAELEPEVYDQKSVAFF